MKKNPGYSEAKRTHTIALGIFLIIVVLLCAALMTFPMHDFHVLAEFIAISGILIFFYTLKKIHHPEVLCGVVKEVNSKGYLVATKKGDLIAHDPKSQDFKSGEEVYVVSELTNYILEQEPKHEETKI